MNQEIKQLWVKALRSGKYTQGRGKLHQYTKRTGLHSFCCLGVLCDLAVNAGIIPSPDKNIFVDSENNVVFSYGKYQTASLPVEVIQWAELKTGSPSVSTKDDGRTMDLIVQNDSGASFEKIANLIENAEIIE